MHTQATLLSPLVNGKWSSAIDVQDRGLAYGDGLFETVLWYQGDLPHWPRHLDRLRRGCERLDIPFEADVIQAQLKLFLQSLAERADTPHKAIIKLILTRGVGGRGYTPLSAAAIRPNLVVQVLPYQTSPWAETGVELVPCRMRLSQNASLAGIKHLNRLEYILAAKDSGDLSEGVFPLLQDTADRVIETLHHNLFIFRNQQLWTPDLQACGVEGVLREHLVAHSPFSVQVARLSLADVLAADEVFICNSVRGIWPVNRFMDRQWPIGEVTLRLQQDLRQRFGGIYD